MNQFSDSESDTKITKWTELLHEVLDENANIILEHTNFIMWGNADDNISTYQIIIKN